MKKAWFYKRFVNIYGKICIVDFFSLVCQKRLVFVVWESVGARWISKYIDGLYVNIYCNSDCGIRSSYMPNSRCRCSHRQDETTAACVRYTMSIRWLFQSARCIYTMHDKGFTFIGKVKETTGSFWQRERYVVRKAQCRLILPRRTIRKSVVCPFE